MERGRDAKERGEHAHRALSKWLGTKPDPDAQAKVEALEQRLKLKCPDSFRDYLLATAPIVHSEDPHETNWWPLDRLRSVSEELGERAEGAALVRALGGDPGKNVLFADYLSWAYAWAVDCSDGPERGRVVLVCGGAGKVAANSFAEFVSLAMANSDRIHGGGEAVTIAPVRAASVAPFAQRAWRFGLQLVLVMILSAASALAAILLANGRG